MASIESMISKGKARYTVGVNKIGRTKYTECGDKGGMGTAHCLHEAKSAMTVADWADKWENAMRSSLG